MNIPPALKNLPADFCPVPFSPEHHKQVMEHFNYAALARRLPLDEICYVQNMMGVCCPTIRELRFHLVFNRLVNAICNNPACGDKSNIFTLNYCGACEMTWYCSTACQLADWPVHCQWCCQPDGPHDTGFLAVSLVHTASGDSLK